MQEQSFKNNCSLKKRYYNFFIISFFMSILLFVICFVYAGIFYVLWGEEGLSASSFFPSTIYNSILYLAIWGMFAYFFSSYWVRLSSEKISEKKDLEYYKSRTRDLLVEYGHYISYVFFYIWVFIVASILPWVYFSYCLFFTNIFVLLFFAAFRHTEFSFDFLRVNQIIFSMIYIYSYVYIMITGNNFFGFIDFINSFLLIWSFFWSMYLSHALRKDSLFIWNVYLYLYVFILFYSSFLFENNYVFLSIVNIAIAYIAIWLAQKTEKNQLDPKKIRAFGLLSWYIWSLVWAYSLIVFWENIWIYTALIFSVILNFVFHGKYQNYISLFFSLFIFSILLFVPSFWNISGAYNFIFILFYSYFLVASTYFFQKKYAQDYYFIHWISYIYNIWAVVFFIVYYSPSFLQLALLMFLEFFFMFLSYYRLTGK